ncbi:MAG: hypothetical protein GY927_06670 [bacterium]|nr:hypothetical protein [bacterium]
MTIEHCTSFRRFGDDANGYLYGDSGLNKIHGCTGSDTIEGGAVTTSIVEIVAPVSS